jgi:ATP-dependent exoDNAse (exonuclease V) alpha subunit
MTQEEALAIMESGASVLLTGAAGSGKTYVLNQYIQRARRKGKSVAVTATTGLAATHLNGTTIHSWSGIGVHSEFDKSLTNKLGKTRQEIINKADILIIDEISMLHDFRLDMVDQVLRSVRESNEPFGGIQVILSGDFFQLPPINRVGERTGSFVTGSQVWSQNVFTVCYLETQFRQIYDESYAAILNGIRAGVLTRQQLKALEDRTFASDDPFTTRTHLLTMNIDVDEVNNKKLETIDGSVHEYQMETHGKARYVEQLQRACLAPQLLRLKRGAQVMCLKNAQDHKYVNGTLGQVVGFEDVTDYPIIQVTDGRKITVRTESWELMDGEVRRATIMQLPLRLAWAITVHKSQGMTLDAARIDLSRAFVEGMGYVALSRVRSIKHLLLDGMNGVALRVSPLARQIDSELRARSHQALDDYAERIRTWQAEEAKEKDKPVTERSAESFMGEPELLEALRKWRSRLASQQGTPPYVIAHDKSLQGIATLKPQHDQALLGISGFGIIKVHKYGADIYKIVQEYENRSVI